MNSLALTPFFQWLVRHTTRPAVLGVEDYPAPAAGNHAGEAVFLAIATALLTATAVAPLTFGLASAWLRWPLGLLLLFLLPHVVMALVSLVSAKVAGTRWHRGVAQDWSCLIVMTAYAASRVTAIGWTAWICRGWLIFMAVNTVLLLTYSRSKHS